MWQAVRATRAEARVKNEVHLRTAEAKRAIAAEARARDEAGGAIRAEKQARAERDHALKAEAKLRIEAEKTRAINDFLTTDLLTQAEPLFNAVEDHVTLLEVETEPRRTWGNASPANRVDARCRVDRPDVPRPGVVEEGRATVAGRAEARASPGCRSGRVYLRRR